MDPIQAQPFKQTAHPALLWQALGAFAFCVVLTWVLGAQLQSRNLVQGLLLTELLFFALPAVTILWFNWPALDQRPFEVPPPKDAGLALALAVAVAALAVAKGLAVRRELGVALPTEPLPWPLVFALAAPTPLCEELLFRPVLQRIFGLYWRPATAVLAVALLFALLHGSLLRFPETFLLGIFSGVVYLKTGNYWACVLFHAGTNLVGPVLWQNTERLGAVFHPLTSVLFGIVALGLAAAFRRPASPLRSLWAKLRWALFGGADAAAPSRQSGPAPVLAYWSGAALMSFLVGVVTVAEVNHAREQRAAPHVSQTDVWRLDTNAVIHAKAQLQFEKWPRQRYSMTLALPYAGCQVQTAHVADMRVPHRQVGAGTFEIVWPEQLPATPRTLVVVWKMPLSELDRETDNYTARLQALLPVNRYSLDFVLDEGSAFEFEHTPEARAVRVFSIDSAGKSARNDFGSCGIGLRPKRR